MNRFCQDVRTGPITFIQKNCCVEPFECTKKHAQLLILVVPENDVSAGDFTTTTLSYLVLF